MALPQINTTQAAMNNEVTQDFHCWQLACFDLDGTLARTSTGQHLAQKMGHAAAMAVMEARYAQGLASNREVAELDGAYYRGYGKHDIARLLDDLPYINDIAETVSTLSKLGIPSIVCTLAWDFVAEIVAQRFGFVAWSGSSLASDPQGQFTGAVSADFQETDKPIFVQRFCRQQQIEMRNVFAVGDSRSDIPLFGAVGFSVALNANAQARAAATAVVNSNSLLDVLNAIPRLKRQVF